MKNLNYPLSARKWSLAAFAIIVMTSPLFAQQPFYDVTAGNGNGIRFWQSNSYKIHMGSASEYLYGPVQDYSIKMNMIAGYPT